MNSLLFKRGPIWTADPSCPRAEALLTEAAYFVECIEKKQEPFNNGEAGWKVVRMLEAADLSLKSGGKRVVL